VPVNRHRLCDTFLALSRIPSPSRREGKTAAWIKRWAEGYRIAVEEDDAASRVGGECGNLFLRLPGKGCGPRLFLCAHLDTIESSNYTPTPRVEGDEIVSDSGMVGADDKCGVSVLLEALACLREEKLPHADLCICFTVCEEIELLGAKAIGSERLRGYDAGVVLDHSAPDEIPCGAPGKRALAITVQGRGGHGAHPESCLNAAHILARAMGRLPSGRLDEHSTACLGILRSGTAVNVIPETAYAEYEIRSHLPELLRFHLENALGIIEATVRAARIYRLPADVVSGEKGVIHKATVEVEVSECYEPYRLTQDDLPVRLLRQAVAACGLTPRLLLAAGGSDANIFNRRGLPTALLGCGMHGAHSRRERASLSEMAQAAAVIVKLATAGA